MRSIASPRVCLVIALCAMTGCLSVPGEERREVQKTWDLASVMREKHAIVSLAGCDGAAIEVAGQLVDGLTGSPLGDLPVALIRFEVDGDPELADLTLIDIAVAAVESRRFVTDPEGRFVASDLEPGRYSLQVAWKRVPEGTDVVVWALKWFERPIEATKRLRDGGEHTRACQHE